MRLTAIYYTIFALFPCFAFAQTQQQLDSMERLIPKRQGKEKVLLLNDLTFYYFQSNPQKAVKFGEQSLKLAKQLNDDKLLANTYNDCSMPYLITGDLEKALELNRKALEIRRVLKDTAGIVSSQSKIGNAYFEMNRYSEAQKAYNEAIRLAKIQHDETKLVQIYQNSANILELSGLVKEALQMQEDILEIGKKLDDDNIITVSLGNMGSCYKKLKNYQKSRECYFEAIKYANRTGNREVLSSIYQGLGVTERESGNHSLGLEYYKKAYSISKSIDSEIGEAMIAINIGNTYGEMKQFDSAQVYLQEGLNIVLKNKSYRQIANAYHSLGQMEFQRKNYKKSAEYLELQNLYKDSVILYQGSDLVTEMFTKYEVEKKERDLAESKAQASENRLQTVIWGSISIGLGFLLLVIFLYFRRKRLQARKELERTKKEEELLREKQLNEQKLEISRELHDNIGSQITYMISSMDNLTYVIPEEDKLNDSIKNISEFGRGTMQELRSTIWAMNAEEGSVEILLRKIEELRSRMPLEIIIENRLEGNPLLKAIEMLNLYRIAQEALQNSLKYANATKITVSVFKSNEGVTIEFSDNGKGFDLKQDQDGNGLRNMRYRCESLGGSFDISSSEGNGTTLSCHLRHLSY